VRAVPTHSERAAGLCYRLVEYLVRGEEELPPKRETVISLMIERPSPIRAAALSWWTRTQLDFQQHLECDERIRISRYDQACNPSTNSPEAISELLRIALPARSTASIVGPQLEVFSETDLHPDVETLCKKPWDSFAGCPEHECGST
jgi:hypothetical protein